MASRAGLEAISVGFANLCRAYPSKLTLAFIDDWVDEFRHLSGIVLIVAGDDDTHVEALCRGVGKWLLEH